MTSHATVGVNDDLAPGQTRVAHGAANHKSSRWIDVVFGIFVEQVSRDSRLDDVLENIAAEFVIGYSFRMLSRNHHRVHAHGFVVFVVFNRNLRLAIRTQVRKLAVLADVGKPHAQLVRQRNRHGHEFRRLPARVAHHHSLVTGATSVNAHGDVTRLLVDAGYDCASVGIKAIERVVVADGGNRASHQ